MCVCVLEIHPGIASLRSEGPRFSEQLEPQPQPQLPTLRGGGGGGAPLLGGWLMYCQLKGNVSEGSFLSNLRAHKSARPQERETEREACQRARIAFPSRKLFENAPSDLSCAPRDPRLRQHQETPGLFHIFPLFIFISAEVWEPVNNRQLGWQEITRISERNVIILATGLGQNRPLWISCLFISRLWRLPRSETHVVRVFCPAHVDKNQLINSTHVKMYHPIYYLHLLMEVVWASKTQNQNP